MFIGILHGPKATWCLFGQGRKRKTHVNSPRHKHPKPPSPVYLKLPKLQRCQVHAGLGDGARLIKDHGADLSRDGDPLAQPLKVRSSDQQKSPGFLFGFEL